MLRGVIKRGRVQIVNSRTKYSNVSCRCVSNHTHKSRGEAGYCDELRLMKIAKEFKDYEVEKNFPIVVNGVFICTHYPDFLITKNDGTQEIREYKGLRTDNWNIKKNLFVACYPDIPYIVINHRPRTN